MLQVLLPSNSSMDSESHRRGSTSQMCLHKILSIITTIPPPLAAAAPPFSGSETKELSPEDETGDENKVSGFDLNVVDAWGLSSSSTTGLEGDGSAAGGGGCFNVDNENGGDRVENSHSKIEEAEGSLTLLIEAAKLIFGEFMDESELGKENVSRCSEVKKDEVAADIEPNEGKLRTAAEMGGEFEEPPSSPVVRSKRGRTQALPGKYRDSVLEPLTRFSRTRSSIVPSKRRRR